LVVKEAPERIRDLIGFGARFDTIDGDVALTQEGGHSRRRVVHALGDATGKEVMRALVASAQAASHVSLWPNTFTIDLLTRDGECRGALVWNERHGKTFVWAKQILLATGGAGRLFRETTNPEIATADGHAMAFRAGVSVRDMEFMQFHPTVLYIAGSSRYLISEAVRGEGAYLRDCNGKRFMGDYSPGLELAPRDIVSLAITRQMDRTRHHCVYLDLTHLPRTLIDERFPNIKQVCAQFSLDLTRDLIPVRPGAHYMIGGVNVDSFGRTSLPRLWAAGEVTSTGLHGANRLASNSLLEGLVFGLRAARQMSAAALDEPDSFCVPTQTADFPEQIKPDASLRLDDLINSLNSEMWRNVGIERSVEGLHAAQQQVEFWDRYVGLREFHNVQGWELQNMLLTARLMICAALMRTESRGTHYRSDFPQANPDFARHITIHAESADI
jgi:L-aspartate oxidase